MIRWGKRFTNPWLGVNRSCRYKKAIEIIDGALTNNVQYICIYTNTHNLTGICETLRLYYCGFSKSEVTYAAAQCEEQGLLKDEFVTDIIDCFEKRMEI